MRPINADALIVELEKDEAFFDKEAEEARENPNNCTEGYADAMWSRANGIRDAIMEIYDAPTIEVGRPKGEWIEEYHGNGWNDYWDYICSNCGKKYERADAILYKANFCPNCGANMREKEDK